MPKSIDEKVTVQARTHGHRIVPIQITWRKKNYLVGEVKQRRVIRAQGGKVEEMKVSVIAWKHMLLEYDHGKQLWTLLTVESDE